LKYQVGDVPVPGYKLLHWLGTGSYGEVWKANGPGGVSCALKFINLDSKSGLKEFRAIGLVKRLQHPNLVPVQAIWLKDPEGNFLADDEPDSLRLKTGGTKVLIIAMGLGQKSLAQRLDECREKGGAGIPERELIRYMEHAADGIDYLNEPIHDFGQGPASIIHCDIKPANLLIVGGGVQVCDYGVAKAIGHDIRKTIAAGTPAYAPPELINSEPGAKTDQYSLAMTYFELRTGTLPFPEERAILSNLTGQLDLTSMQKDEREVLRRAFSADQKKRYATCRELVDELKVALGASLNSGSRPVATAAPSPIEKPRLVEKSVPPSPPPPKSERQAPAEAPIVLQVRPALPEVRNAHSTLQPADSNRLADSTPSTPAQTIPAQMPVWTGPPAAASADVLPADFEYKILRRLGHGTFGEVFEAEAPGGFKVAVKRISRSLDHPASKGERESLEALKNTSHPFLLQTHAYWVHQDQLVIVMELAEGSLADRISHYQKLGQPGMPAEELVTYFQQAAEALDYLHGQNVTHRDIKPQNLLYLKGYAKVADFGLARTHQHTQTTVGEAMGTPLFMAPEVWGKRVSIHSDQYSLAATYVAARLGRPLFKTELIHELAMQHLLNVPDLNPLPAEEQKALRKALAKRPDDRYPSCKAFVEALKEAVHPPLPQPLAASRPRWNPVALAAATLVLFAIGAAALWISKDRGTATVLSPPEIPPVVDPVWCPKGWIADAMEEPRLHDGKKYPKRLTRKVGVEELVAIRIDSNRLEGKPFYILRDKVTNQVFRTEWDKKPNPEIDAYKWDNAIRAEELFPGIWRKGAVPLEGLNGQLKALGIDDEQAKVPVVNVTMVEATLVARELGGRLPTHDQWLAALGKGGEGEGLQPPFVLGGPPPQGLALDLKRGPWPVDRDTPDKSIYGVRGLLTNGYEWTRETPDNEVIVIKPLPSLPPNVNVVGQTWTLDEVLTSTVLAARTKLQFLWDDTLHGIGFRVVLEP